MPTRTLSALSREECVSLLRHPEVHVGRLAVTDADGRPVVMPVNYRLLADSVPADGRGVPLSVIVRTAPGSLLAERAVDRPVAFEVDAVDATWEEGWSVLVQATAERVTEPVLLERVRRLPLRPWAPGERTVYLRIPLDMVTGRRIT